MICIESPALFDGESMRGPAALLIDGGKVLDILASPPSGIPVPRLPVGSVLAPGFVDLQVNGGDGVLLNDEPSVAGLRRIAGAHVRHGTTSLLPTLISGDRAAMLACLSAVREALAQRVPGVLGLHIEGPFINPVRRGIHPAAAITTLTDDYAFLFAPTGFPLLVTLAPEIVSPQHVAALAQAGVSVFLGHSDAPSETANAALAHGAVGFTHLYNAMSQLGSRAPGMVGAALADTAAIASIIIDGHHVHPTAVRAAFGACGSKRLALISDAMPSVGADTGFMLAGKAIHLSNGRLTDAAGTLAGAHLTMLEAVQNAVRMCGIPLADALRMATATPADALRLSDIGRIAAGTAADFVALDASLALTGVWCAGERVV